MQNIVQEVEGAVAAAEADAKKIETDVAGKVHAFVAKLEADAKTFASDVERAKLVTELEELVRKLRHPVQAVDPTVTQADKDAEEDARAIEGTFKRFVRRIWSWV